MQQVWLWVERNDGQIEQHVGPFNLRARDAQGRPLVDQYGDALLDEKFAGEVHKVLAGFHGQNAYDVAKSLDRRNVEKDKTGALRRVAVALAEISARVVTRQQRAESASRVEAGNSPLPGHPPLRALWLADIELAQMKVYVRGE